MVEVGGFGRAVALADDLNQSVAGIDLPAQPLPQLAVAGGKVILRNRIKIQGANCGGNGPAGLPNSSLVAERKRRGRSM